MRPRSPRARRRVVAAVGLVIAATAFATGLHRGAPSEAPSAVANAARGPTQAPLAKATTVATATPSAVAPRTRQRAIATRLRAAVAAAGRLGGTATAAIMLDGWRDPVTASSVPGGSNRTVRMWSTSKVATAVLLLRQLGWGAQPGQAPSPEVRSALEGALRRSENCRQRRVVLAVEAASGSPPAAAAQLSDLLLQAGAHPQIARRTHGPDALCAGYLRSQTDLPDPSEQALELGTSRWRMSDAALFAHALGAGQYGRAVTERVLAIMRMPKLRSREAPAGDFTPALDWGAGAALGCGSPAYKAGWGGAAARSFVAEQIAVFRRGSRTAAIAVAFAPAAQPAIDDPGLTPAPAAIELVMSRMAGDLVGTSCSPG